MTMLADLVSVCRSKNAGPFVLTLDIVCKDEDAFRQIQESGIWTSERLAGLYGVPTTAVDTLELPFVLAFKANLPRLVGSGDFADTDVYGAQQHAPLLQLRVP